VAFDAELWRAQHGTPALEQVNPRGDMAAELREEHLVPGTGRDRVLELLGPPEFQVGDTDRYELGRSPFGASYEQLAIEYDDDAIVRTFVIRT
jgi:hypothetical protein